MLDPFDPTPPQKTPVATAPTEEAATASPADAPSDTAVEADVDEVWEADEVLAGATDQARTALELITPANTIGEPLGYIVEGEHVLSLLFDCLMTGYPGWRWTVSLSRVDGDAEPQVLETELMPGDDALLAPEWVPWSDRLADVKVAEELAAVELVDEDYGDEDDDDSDEDTDDESAESDDVADDGVDVLDGIDFDEALTASQLSEPSAAPEQHEAETGQAKGQADDRAPQPPVQARGMQFSSENDSARQGD
ncbi:DUF3027 domain-containing protein [Cryobacterium sp.]|jgi:hypothetical protein|uniref:DUF3027 domain-containing protein n=1 Tax=Cryobacterium sp. TaxID=1926290 RepID=UPI002618F0BB|nr:DUF3027 domain-containing protein [Cryobacterium sp.]MCU1447254.1 hypothetical protein [Cryobacterium sp.]